MKPHLHPVMLAGTGSDVGKSVLATALCRIVRQDGYVPALFLDAMVRLNSGKVTEAQLPGILKNIPAVRVNGDTAHRLPNTSSVSFEGIEGESILMHLDRYGICASSGSACTTGSLEPSHVLRAMGLPYTAAHGTIRFSFSRDNNADEVRKVLEVLPGIIAGLRELSPFWDGEKVRR